MAEYEYRMNKEQYGEMKRFYEKLGFSNKQVEKLCDNCFKASVVIDNNRPYSPDWSFTRMFRPTPVEKVIDKLNTRRKGLSKPSGRGAVCDEMVEEVCREMPEPMMMGMAAASMPAPGMMGMNAMMGGMPAPGLGIPAPMPATPAEFNTAETEAPDENEAHSPLDSPAAIFSANVNTASWSYIRGKLSMGKPLDPDFVRIEEIINSYHYKLKKPAEGELFSLSAESGGCPWDEDSELFFVGMRAKKGDKKVHQNLCMLIDVSGSMDDRWVLTQMAVASIVSKLKKGDTVSIIAYSDNTVTVAKNIDCGDMGDCVKAILSIDGIGGCTNGSEGLENAYKYLEENYDKEGNNRVFIFTDGDFNFGVTSKGGLEGFIKEKRETGIYLSIVGFGYNNFKDDKMETLARNGNGNYTFVTNPMDILDNLHEKLISNLITVANDVKISVEMNPKFVSKYRLIGYDARALTVQEFHDTKKATDGIGSEHNVVALIQFSRGKAENRFANRYVSTSSADNDTEFAFIEVHYKDTDGNDLVATKAVTLAELEGAKNKNMPVATLLAAFGLLIKKSDYRGTVSKEMLLDLLGKLPDEEKEDKKYSHFSIIQKYAAAK